MVLLVVQGGVGIGISGNFRLFISSSYFRVYKDFFIRDFKFQLVVFQNNRKINRIKVHIDNITNISNR